MGAEYINIIILFSLVFIDIYFCWNSGFLVRRAASFLPINRWMSSFRLEREERTPEDDQPLGGQPLYLAAEITTDNISLSLSLLVSSLKGDQSFSWPTSRNTPPQRSSCNILLPCQLRRGQSVVTPEPSQISRYLGRKKVINIQPPIRLSFITANLFKCQLLGGQK